jgi:hypothetical protein
VVPDAQAGRDAAGTQIGLMAADGSTRWLSAHPVSSSSLGITVPQPVASVAVVARAHGAAVSLARRR